MSPLMGSGWRDVALGWLWLGGPAPRLHPAQHPLKTGHWGRCHMWCRGCARCLGRGAVAARGVWAMVLGPCAVFAGAKSVVCARGSQQVLAPRGARGLDVPGSARRVPRCSHRGHGRAAWGPPLPLLDLLHDLGQPLGTLHRAGGCGGCGDTVTAVGTTNPWQGKERGLQRCLQGLGYPPSLRGLRQCQSQQGHPCAPLASTARGSVVTRRGQPGEAALSFG